MDMGRKESSAPTKASSTGAVAIAPLPKPFYGEQNSCTYKWMDSADFKGVETLSVLAGKTLGSGTYAKVKAVWSTTKKELLALKIINKKVASADYLNKFLPREIEVMQRISHPYIIQCHSIIETERQAFFVMELAQNGDLLDYINARRRLPEHESRHVFGQIAEGIDFLHCNNICHRDLKCENILLSKRMMVKIADFGFACDLSVCPTKTPCGSYSYAAPELFTRPCENYDGKKADVWSMGVILYAMACGKLAFGDDSTVRRAEGRILQFPKNVKMTEELKSLITSLLHEDPEKRFSTSDIFAHAWPTSGYSLQPASTAKTSGAKFTRENCGIALPPLHPEMKKLEALHRALDKKAAAGAIPEELQGHSRPFLTKLGQRLASAVKPRRNASE